MQDFSRFLIEKIILLVPLKVKRIFAIEAGNLLDFGKIIKKKNSRMMKNLRLFFFLAGKK